MRQLLLMLLAGAALFACKKDCVKTDVLTGTYTGTFQRIGHGSNGPISNVSITFTSNAFTGQSDTQYYPALCKGSYRIEGEKIIFRDSCFWTANFDGTLILSGEYDLKINGDNIEITRSSNGTIFQQDVYKLVKHH